MALPAWVLPIVFGGAQLLQGLFGKRREGAQYIPMPMPPVILPNPVLYELGAINKILSQLPGGIALEAPPGFNPQLPPWQQWHIPTGWESMMRRMGYGRWHMPPVNFFDVLLDSLMAGLVGWGIGKQLKGG